MIRAAVLIGVADTGGFPHLEAVGKGIGDVKKWILDQGDFGDRVEILTDAGGEAVTADAIKQVIRRFLKLGTIEQLLIYFAGHGMNVGYQEFWLLSDAADDSDAAVNLAGSVVLARHCGITHVVFISDACRSAADSIAATATTGSVIFPNRGPRREPGVVDVFYAAAVGDPALEVRTRDEAAGEYHAIYTTALVRGLTGTQASIIEPGGPAGKGLIRPWPLQRYLPGAVTGLLTLAGLQLTESQVPNAVISSPPETWLATVNASSTRRAGLGLERTSAPHDTLSTLSDRAVAKAIRGGAIDTGAIVGTAVRVPGAAVLASYIDAPLVVPPVHFDSHCGFAVDGMSVLGAHSSHGRVFVEGGEPSRVHVDPAQGRPANVLLGFANGTGALLPAIPDFVGRLTFDGQRLMAVSYEPAADTLLRTMAEPDLPAVAELRRVIAAAARLGTFRLNRDSADELISRMRTFKFVDPCLAVYAAHALADLNRPEDIADMDAYVWQDRHLHFFDVAMLQQSPGGEGTMPPEVYPAVPLLTQAWPLLEAYGVQLPEALARARRHLTNSLWTLFNPHGVALMKAATTAGVI